MKIGEILNMTQEKKISEIAKEHLEIGEKAAREALKNAGCFSKSGVRGWYFEGDEGILEKSIYEFTNAKPTTNQPNNEPTDELNNVGNNEGINEPTNEQTKQQNNEPTNVVKNEPTNERKNVKKNEPTNVGSKTTKEETNEDMNERKRASFDINKNLLKELKVKSVLEDRNMYEILEDAIRDYLKK